MRENRLSGSEGGGAEINRLSLPLWEKEDRPRYFWAVASYSTVAVATGCTITF